MQEIIEPEAPVVSEVEEVSEVIECLEDMDEEIYTDAVENVITMNDDHPKMFSLMEATDKAKEDLSNVEILLHPDRVEKVVCKWLLHLHLSHSTVLQNLCKSEDPGELCEPISLLKDVNMECESENEERLDARTYSEFIERHDKNEAVDKHCWEGTDKESITEVGVSAEEYTSKSKINAKLEDSVDQKSIDFKGNVEMVSTSSIFGCTKSLLEESAEEVKEEMQDENLTDESSPKAAQMENLENLKKSKSTDDRTDTGSLFGKSPTTGDSSTCDDSDDYNRKPSKKRQKEESNQKEKEQKIPKDGKEDLEISPKENQCFDSFQKDSFEEGSMVPEKLALEQSTSASQCKETMEASKIAESDDLESDLQKSNEASSEANLNPPVKSPTNEKPVKADRKLSSDSVGKSADFPWITGEEFFQIDSSQSRSSTRWISRKVGRWLISDEICNWSSMEGDVSDCPLGRQTDSWDDQYGEGNNELALVDQDWTNDHGLEESRACSEEYRMSFSDRSNKESQSNDGSSVFEKSVFETATNYNDSTLERRPFRKLPEMSTDVGSLLQRSEYSIQDFGDLADGKVDDNSDLNDDSTNKNEVLIFQDTKLLLKCFISDPFGLSLEYHKQISELATLCFQLGHMGNICSKVFQSSCYVQCSGSNFDTSLKSVDQESSVSSKNLCEDSLSMHEIGSKVFADITCRNIGQQTPKLPGCMDSYCKMENQYQTKCTCGTFCHLAGKFDQLHKLSSSRSHCLSDCLLTSADHFDLQMSLFIRCYFHCLSLEVIKSHVYNDNGYCFRSWMALVQCLQGNFHD